MSYMLQKYMQTMSLQVLVKALADRLTVAESTDDASAWGRVEEAALGMVSCYPLS